MSSSPPIRRLARSVFIGAAVIVVVCVPWVLAAEACGWSQRPVHLLQSFVAVPVAFVSSVVFLCLRTPAEAPKWERRAAWAVCVLSGAWLAMLIWVCVALARGMFPGPA